MSELPLPACCCSEEETEEESTSFREHLSLSLSLSIQVYSDISSRAWQFHSFEKEIENDGKLFEIESSFLQQEFSSKENMSENKLV